MADRVLFGGKVAEISISVHRDARGVLTLVQFGRFGFQPRRAFVVTAPHGTTRGGHGHRTGRQLFMHVSGEIYIALRYREEVEQIVLDSTNKAVLIEAPVWSSQTYHGDNPTMIVFSDTEYDPKGYLLDVESGQ
ncbi:hypothetical protein FJW08_07610 [Mesorhizobium sp. B3-2-1]|uniref:sugar 3,4-ketoisomerase n=1 Tax=Mesorhizobium sp. B3-2-1 TaxID=2589891 RepID=UPI0011272F96|nr:FdtA/QdtA family cupin domain-containing protein [Mesorhizobium sp. B3-2-1]TPI33029.1 hypothetical protein FJW08_07610 [Mesorhizobium sp. B3-2-1]